MMNSQINNEQLIGAVHSFQSLGAVDGPGIRYVIFMQGCPYRCPYCHNPDTREFFSREGASVTSFPSSGTSGFYHVNDIVKQILRYRSYFGSHGGVTVSGGEPLCQQGFVLALFKELKALGINTALDTAGARPTELTKELLEFTDTVLCDIKFPDEERYREHLGISLCDILDFLSLCRSMKKDIVIRHVVVPGMTDTEENIKEIMRLALSACNPRKVELLPFRKLCVEKYDRLGIKFPLDTVDECSNELITSLRSLIPTELG